MKDASVEPRNRHIQNKSPIIVRFIIVAVTLMISVFLGLFFETSMWQASIVAAEKFDGRPLPSISALFFQNHRICPYLMIATWIGFMVAPSVIGNRHPSTPEKFLFRFAAFSTVQAFMFLLLFLFLLIPFLPYYQLLETRKDTVIETTVIALFWIGFAIVAIAMIRTAALRLWTRRKAESQAPSLGTE